MEMAYGWATINKAERQADGSVLVTGLMSDAGKDRDGQGMNQAWLDQVAQRWFDESGNIREQHDRFKAAGVGVNLVRKTDGGWVLQSRIVDPVAALKCLPGPNGERPVYQGYSIGIREPRLSFEKAEFPAGEVVGGYICEVSLADRPSNPRTIFSMVKTDDAGNPIPGEGALELTEEPDLDKAKPGQRYRHGWIPITGDLVSAEDEHGHTVHGLFHQKGKDGTSTILGRNTPGDPFSGSKITTVRHDSVRKPKPEELDTARAHAGLDPGNVTPVRGGEARQMARERAEQDRGTAGKPDKLAGYREHLAGASDAEVREQERGHRDMLAISPNSRSTKAAHQAAYAELSHRGLTQMQPHELTQAQHAYLAQEAQKGQDGYAKTLRGASDATVREHERDHRQMLALQPKNRERQASHTTAKAELDRRGLSPMGDHELTQAQMRYLASNPPKPGSNPPKYNDTPDTSRGAPAHSPTRGDVDPGGAAGSLSPEARQRARLAAEHAETQRVGNQAMGEGQFAAAIRQAEAAAAARKAKGKTEEPDLFKYVSAAQRDKYADSGVAMPNGDFPIADRDHLTSALGLLSGYKGDKAAAKAHIKKRAAALGVDVDLDGDDAAQKLDAIADLVKAAGFILDELLEPGAAGESDEVETMDKAELSAMIAAAVTSATEDLAKAVGEQGKTLAELSGRLDKVEAAPAPGGPVQVRSPGATQLAKSSEVKRVEAEIADYLEKADGIQSEDPNLAAGYREQAETLRRRLTKI